MAKIPEKVYIETMCPVCGRMMGKINIIKKTRERSGWSKYAEHKETVEYLEYLKNKWDPSKDWWGCVRDASGGRAAGFHIIQYYHSRDDNPELFDMWKEQILRGIEWVIGQGWVDPKDVEGVLKKFKGGKK